jgi:hypothetical protein
VPADVLPTKRRADVESFHLARSPFNFPQCYTTTDRIADKTEQKPALRRSVLSGKVRNFLTEVLKAEINPDGTLVLEKELSCYLDVRWCLNLYVGERVHAMQAIDGLPGTVSDTDEEADKTGG